MVLLIQLKTAVFSLVPKLRKAFNLRKRFAVKDLGRYWFNELLPEHFESSAHTEFDYLPRDKDWLESKLKFGLGKGRKNDLMLSGKSLRFLTHGPVIKATSANVSIQLSAPVYFSNPRYKTPGHPDKSDEVTRVSRRHRDLLSRHFETVLTV